MNSVEIYCKGNDQVGVVSNISTTMKDTRLWGCTDKVHFQRKGRGKTKRGEWMEKGGGLSRDT